MASAVQNPFMIVPILVATKSEGSSLPTVALDLEVELELSRTPSAPKTPEPIKQKKKKVVAKKVPPPPPPKETTKDVTVAPLVVKSKEIKPKEPSFSLDKLRKQMGYAGKRVADHRYASVAWATLVIVWAPLLVILIINKFMGKEGFIELLVRILPDDVPASYIEKAVEDTVWIGIVGLTGVLTVGMLMVEMTRLAMSIATSTEANATTKRKS